MDAAQKKDSRIRSRIFGIASKLFVAAIGVWVATQLWPHWEAYLTKQPPKPDAPSLTQQPLAPPPAPDVATSLLGTDSSTSEKPLKLVLVGTVAGRTLEESRAMMGTDPRNPQTFAGGATLSNGARIEEVHADRIVLKLNGRRETLMVDREAPARVAMNSVVNDQREQKGYPILTPAFTEGTEGSPASLGGKNAQYVEREATSYETLSQVVRAVPVFENEKFTGMKVLAGTSNGRLAVLGLEAGDIVRKIDGKYVESDAAWTRIEDALSMGRKLVISIERNGAIQTMTLDGSRLDDEGAAVANPSPAIAQSS